MWMRTLACSWSRLWVGSGATWMMYSRIHEDQRCMSWGSPRAASSVGDASASARSNGDASANGDARGNGDPNAGNRGNGGARGNGDANARASASWRR